MYNYLLFSQVTKHYYRGARIFNAVVKDLLAKGMKDAKNVFHFELYCVAQSSILQELQPSI